MSLFKKILSSGVKEIADGVGGVIDAINAPGIKKEELKVQVQEIVDRASERMVQDMQANDKEATERHRIDMASDSWLSKNIRPLSLVFVTAVVSILAFATIWTVSKDQIPVLEIWVGLFTALLLVMYGFYFGRRGLEKILAVVAQIMKIKKG